MRVKTITCPNCGHANNFLAEECTQCGINFSRYYEELEKAENLRRHIEEQEKAEAQQPSPEEPQPAEEDKAPVGEDTPENQKQADMLKRQQEALDRAAARHRQREKKNGTPQLGEENPLPADADTAEIDELDPADIEEQAGAFDFIEYPADDLPDAGHTDTPDTPDFPLSDYPPAASLEDRLRVYEGRMLGITYGDPAEIQNVKLLAVSRDHFQVFYPVSRHVVSFPYSMIVSITENAKGVSAVGPDISPVFPMVVEVPRPFFHVE